MVTLCTNCGTPLPGSFAKFCTTCGALTPSHPFNSRSPSAPLSNSFQVPGTGRTERSDSTRPIIREQVAHLPQNADRPVRNVVRDEPPPWMSRLDNGNTSTNNRTSSGAFSANDANKSPQLDFPSSEPLPHPNSAPRELRVKVWQQEDPISSPGLPRQGTDASLNEDMDDLPTRPLIASPHNPQVPRNVTNAPSAPSRPGQDSRVNELERINTAHLAAPVQMPFSQSTSQSSRGRFDQSLALSEQQTLSLARGTAQRAAPQISYEAVRSASQPVQNNVAVTRATQSQQLKQTPSHLTSVPVSTSRRKRGRKPLVLVIGLLAILLLGGAGVWLGVFHPFSTPAVAQPQQTFTNSQLAFSMQYPNGWNTRVDSRTSSAYFADTSNTAQFTVALSPANGKDAGQYVQQLATRLKITNIKVETPISFGGVSWQQVQGNIFFSGANYTETILATVHSNQLYTITEASPQSTYTQEEQIIFSAMRSSFKFL